MSNETQFRTDVVAVLLEGDFTNGPVNLIDVDTIEQLAELLTRIEQDPDLTVVVFRSENPTSSWRTGTSWHTARVAP